MATTAAGFWYPDEGTSFNINTIMATMASSLQTKVGPHVVDTGWVDCPLNPGTTQQGSSLPQVRRIGKVVYMRWGISGTGRTAGTTTNVFTVPAGFRPVDWKYFPVISNTVGATGRTVVRSDGTVQLGTSSSVGAYYIWDSASWIID